MSNSDLDTRLKTSVALRDRLTAESQRIAGRKEAAEKALSEVEGEIRDKNLDPDTLDQTLDTLNAAYEQAVKSFEQALIAARESLAPYMENL